MFSPQPNIVIRTTYEGSSAYNWTHTASNVLSGNNVRKHSATLATQFANFWNYSYGIRNGEVHKQPLAKPYWRFAPVKSCLFQVFPPRICFSKLRGHSMSRSYEYLFISKQRLFHIKSSTLINFKDNQLWHIGKSIGSSVKSRPQQHNLTYALFVVAFPQELVAEQSSRNHNPSTHRRSATFLSSQLILNFRIAFQYIVW